MTRPLTVEAHMGLVVSIAKRCVRVCSHLDFDDLLNEGVFGLMKALEKFDPERGFAFSTYATHWVRQSIRRAIHNRDRAVRVPVWRADRLQAAGELKRERLASLAAPLSEDGSTLAEILPADDEPADERAERLEREELARAALDLVDERQRAILVARFWGEQTLQQVGAVQPVPVSRERIRQIESEALEALRRRLRDVV